MQVPAGAWEHTQEEKGMQSALKGAETLPGGRETSTW